MSLSSRFNLSGFYQRIFSFPRQNLNLRRCDNFVRNGGENFLKHRPIFLRTSQISRKFQTNQIQIRNFHLTPPKKAIHPTVFFPILPDFNLI